MKFGPWKKYNAGGMFPLQGNTIINLKRFDSINGSVYDTIGPVNSFFWGYGTEIAIVAFQEQIKEPLVERVTLYKVQHTDLYKITYNTINGEPDTTSIKMEKD